MARHSLQSRITVVMWVMAVMSTLVAALISGSLLIRSHRDAIKQQLQATGTSLLSLGISDFDELSDFNELNTFIENALQMEKVDKIIRIYDASRRLVFTTVGLEYDRLPNKIPRKTEKPVFITLEGEQRKYESLVIPYENIDKNKSFYLQVVIPLPKYSHILHSFWWPCIILLSLLILLSLILSRWLALWLLTPVRAIAEHLEKMAPAKLEEWQPIRGISRGQYLGPITRGINSLIEKTQQAFDQLHKMSRYVAHELRTPLTIIRGETEMALQKSAATKEDYSKVLVSSLEEVERMSEIVTTVLKLSEQEHGTDTFLAEFVDLRTWLLENKSLWERTLGRAIEFQDTTLESSTVFLDPKLLFRLMDNLVRNIKHHTPPATSCSILLQRSASLLQVHVQDEGPGLPPFLLRSLNEKGGTLRGEGVGLNLCRRIAELCRIELHFANRHQGGLNVTLGFSDPRKESFNL